MVFLNPSFWWFALAIAIPIIVHLFNFRRPKRILFSNLTFVKEVNKTVLRRIKLKQWLLLASRILAILCIVAAFANPIIQQDGVNVSVGAKSVVVLVDNSYSMSGVDSRGIYIQQAKILAQELVQNHSLSDEFQVLTTGTLRTNSAFTSRSQALERIKEIDYNDRALGYAKILSCLKDVFSEARNANSHFYFLSDFQTATVMTDSIKNLNLPSNIQVTFAPIGNQKQANVYVSDVQFQQAIIEKGKPVTISIKVNNDSEKEFENLSIKINAEGKAVAVASVSLQPNESKTTDVTFTPQKAGWQSGSISIDDMPITFDNTRFFSYNIPQNTKILLVYGSQSSQYLDVLFKNLVTQYKVETISEADLSRASINDYTTIILAGLGNVSSGLSDRLKTWINGGGGLMFFPSVNMDLGTVNNFYQNLGVGKFNQVVNYSTPVTFSMPDLSHPIFETVFIKAKKNAEFDSPNIIKIYDFQPFNTGVQSTVIKDNNNRIALHEAKIGSGNLLTFGFYPSLEWSDFPLKSSYVPILYRSTLLLSNSVRSDFFQTIGSFQLRNIKTSSKDLIKLRIAEANSNNQKQSKTVEIIPEQYSQSGMMTLKFDRSEIQAGNYNIMQGDTLLERISFNHADLESKLNAMDNSKLIDFLEEKNLSQIRVLSATPERIRNDISGNVSGIPLWKYFIIIGLLFIILEIVILKTLKES